MLEDPPDPGVRGTINPAEDDIIFREFRLKQDKVDRYKPFDQTRSDAQQPIRVVVTPDLRKYVLQGNHRVAAAQEEGVQSIGVILYTPAQWAEFSGSPFLQWGTNNPYIGD